MEDRSFPGGEKIAFIRDSPRHGTDIFTVNLDGSELMKLTESATFYEVSLAVSPDGPQIAFASYGFNRVTPERAKKGEAFTPEALAERSEPAEFQRRRDLHNERRRHGEKGPDQESGLRRSAGLLA